MREGTWWGAGRVRAAARAWRDVSWGACGAGRGRCANVRGRGLEGTQGGRVWDGSGQRRVREGTRAGRPGVRRPGPRAGRRRDGLCARRWPRRACSRRPGSSLICRCCCHCDGSPPPARRLGARCRYTRAPGGCVRWVVRPAALGWLAWSLQAGASPSVRSAFSWCGVVFSPCVNDGLAVAFTHAVLLGRSRGDTEGLRALRGDAVRAGLSQTLGDSGGGCPPAVLPPRRALAARGSCSLCGAGSCSFGWSRTFSSSGSLAFPGRAGVAPCASGSVRRRPAAAGEGAERLRFLGVV